MSGRDVDDEALATLTLLVPALLTGG